MFAIKVAKLVVGLAFALTVAHPAVTQAQVPTVGTSTQSPNGFPMVGNAGAQQTGQQQADYNSLPPEVRQLIPQNPGNSGSSLPQPNVVPIKPPGVQPGSYPTNGPGEAFPDLQSGSNSRSGSQDQFRPSEVISVLPPIPKASELRAVLRTSVGDITIKLDRVNAPMTVAQFVGLARGEKEFIDVKTSKPAKRPFYNGLTFHKVVRGFFVQTGCPFGTGRGTAGDIARLADEVRPSMKFDRPGLVAMAPQRDASGLKTLKETNSSQFFITTKEMPNFDEEGMTIFGEVEDGMDVVEKIASVKVGPTERPIKRIYLVAVDIIEGATVK